MGVDSMERIISYDELPRSKGQSIYFRMETDPKLYVTLLSKGYKLINNITDSTDKTIYVTGRRQDYGCSNTKEYKKRINRQIEDSLSARDITKPHTYNFSYEKLINYEYKIPFVLKNESMNGGKEKFLIQTEEDYENLISACTYLFNFLVLKYDKDDVRYQIDYEKYFTENFTIQEYINTPSEYNTTVRLLTSSANDLLYASLKYNKPEDTVDETSLLGHLLHDTFPLSTKSIVSNTLSGGENLLIGENHYNKDQRELLNSHNIDSDNFEKIVETSKDINEEYESELGIICGFDYIYDKEKDNWYLLELHSRPMVGDYSKRQGLPYTTKEDRLTAEGRVRATSLSLVLKKR